MADRGVVAGLGAVLLCGGRSSRMGRSKADLPFEGEPLVARVAGRLLAVCSPVVVVAAPGQALPELPGAVAVVRDAVSGNGPLQGMLAGLGALSGAAESVFVASTDAPFLHAEFVRRVEGLRREGDHDAVVPCAGGHWHVLSAAYRTGAVLPVVEELLARDVRRLGAIFERVRVRFVEEAELLAGEALRGADPGLRSLVNVNSPEDYELALREGERGSGVWR
ncbi:MAG: molybdenum cofactor guanylyltransferase [Polyangiaceae bacterium]